MIPALLTAVLLDPKPSVSAGTLQWMVMTSASAALLVTAGLAALAVAAIAVARGRAGVWLSLPAILLALLVAASQSPIVRGRVTLNTESIVRDSGWPGHKIDTLPLSAVKTIEVRCLAAGSSRKATFDYQITLIDGKRLTLANALPDRSPATISLWIERVEAWDASPSLRQAQRMTELPSDCVRALATYLTPSALDAVDRVGTRAL